MKKMKRKKRKLYLKGYRMPGYLSRDGTERGISFIYLDFDVLSWIGKRWVSVILTVVQIGYCGRDGFSYVYAGIVIFT